MNATSSSERGRADQLDLADLEQSTQSGLPAELLRFQRGKVIESTQRCTHRQQGRGFFGNSLTWLLARARSVTTAVRACVLPRKTYD